MHFRIFAYPKLRQKSVLSELLTPVGIERFRSFLDSRRISNDKGSLFLVSSGNYFILMIFSFAVYDKEQIVLELFEPDDFEDREEIQGNSAHYDNALNFPILSRAVSFALYKAFYVQRSVRISVSFRNDKNNIERALENAAFSFDGTVNRHFRNGSEFYCARVFSITKREFYERSTGLIKFNENFLVIRATEDAVFALDVLRYDSLKERRNIHEHLEVLPNNVFDVVMNEKLYLPAKRYSTLANAVAQICEYISGIRTKFELETETEAATEFQKSVWKATTEIPYGQTVSYDHIASVVSDLKEKLQPGILSRAVGSALSKNPVMIIIPCHRVIGKDGKLRGFAGGIDIKDHLLNHELTNYLRSRRE